MKFKKINIQLNKKNAKIKISEGKVTGPGSAGTSNMPQIKNNKSTNKLPPKQLQKLKDRQEEMITEAKEKIITTQQQQVKSNNYSNIRYDYKLQLTNSTEGEKYLIMHRIDENKTMRNLSPILLETAIKNATQNGNTECKFLKSGDLLIKTQNVKQAQNIIKITGIMDATIQVTEHKTMNSCKGVIRAYELQNEDKETLLDYLKEQNVIDIKMHTKTTNGTTVNTGLVFVTFGVNALPEYLTVGLLRVRVRPYIPTPIRCFACHKYGHLSKYCHQKDHPTCYNCNGTKHIHNKEDKCTEQAFCVNCQQTGHNSYNRNCAEYKRQTEIQTIRVTQNVSMAEAVKRSNLNRVTYAQITSSQTNNPAQTDTICKCQHCHYHNKKESIQNNNTNKRPRTRNPDKQELSTDEETTKKSRINMDEHFDEEEEEEMIT